MCSCECSVECEGGLVNAMLDCEGGLVNAVLSVKVVL